MHKSDDNINKYTTQEFLKKILSFGEIREILGFQCKLYRLHWKLLNYHN